MTNSGHILERKQVLITHSYVCVLFQLLQSNSMEWQGVKAREAGEGKEEHIEQAGLGKRQVENRR